MQIGGKAVAVYDYKITMRRTAGLGWRGGAEAPALSEEEEEEEGEQEAG